MSGMLGNNSLDNGLVPEDTKPIPKLMLIHGQLIPFNHGSGHTES